MIFEEKKNWSEKFFWLDFQGKILHQNDKVLDKPRQKLEIISPGSLKYCPEVVRSLGNRFFDAKYHLEVITRTWEQKIDTQTKKLCPPHILERFGSRLFIYSILSQIIFCINILKIDVHQKATQKTYLDVQNKNSFIIIHRE